MISSLLRSVSNDSLATFLYWPSLLLCLPSFSMLGSNQSHFCLDEFPSSHFTTSVSRPSNPRASLAVTLLHILLSSIPPLQTPVGWASSSFSPLLPLVGASALVSPSVWPRQKPPPLRHYLMKLYPGPLLLSCRVVPHQFEEYVAPW